MAPSRVISEKEMAMHREYMKKYKKETSDLEKDVVRYKDHYELLGIERKATHGEIRRAYRKLALQCHPDRDSSLAAQKRWEGVPSAYAVLSDPNSRMEYDATLPTRDALVSFYKSYNPAKLDNATIQTIIDGWHGREVELFQMLNAKYEIAPHQGVNRRANLQRLPAERARSISNDNQASKLKGGEVPTDHPWMESVGNAFCCKSVFQRLFFKTYYEVETESPAVGFARPSETPGQSVLPNLQSPGAPLSKSLEKKNMALQEETSLSTDEEESSTSIDEDSTCSSTTSTVSSIVPSPLTSTSTQ